VELGTDALKLAAPDDLSLMPTLLEGIREHTAVFFAGGAVRSEAEILMLAEEVVRCGATGLCVGRNIFQRESARATLTRLQEIILGSHAPAPEPTVSWSLPARAQVRWSPVVEEVVK
jgi:class I fructose-bisphosphate aldolase/fructose-bisphosphate aldolase/2-amino-3,7-dideoxy-D-threo-hept-6-ulosonate synthase